jgi:hypothetical protein
MYELEHIQQIKSILRIKLQRDPTKDEMRAALQETRPMVKNIDSSLIQDATENWDVIPAKEL